MPDADGVPCACSARGAEIAPRPDPAAYRARWLLNGVVLAAGLAITAAGVLSRDDANAGRTWGLVLGGLVLAGLMALAWSWQRRTWLATEPSLVLTADCFRILHKGEHSWVPWTDVEEISVAAPGAGFGRVPMLIFRLRPGSDTRLPERRASLLDRLFAWNTDELAYARPREQPGFVDVATAAIGYWSAATGHPLDPQGDT